MLQTFTDISFDTIENDDSNSEHENNQPQYPNSPEPNVFVEVSPHDPLLSKSDPEAHPILRGSLKRKMAEDVKKDSGGSEKKRASQNQSDDYHYLMSLLPDMESFTGVQKYRVRNKINQVIMDELWMLRGRVE